MTIYDLHDADGRPFAFEVENTFLPRSVACDIARSIPGATIVRAPRRMLSWFIEDEFCEFQLDGVRFVMWEPWGDNSRFWIGPHPPRCVPQTALVREAFAHHNFAPEDDSWFPTVSRLFHRKSSNEPNGNKVA